MPHLTTTGGEGDGDGMDLDAISPIQLLPTDTLHYIISLLPLRQALICRAVSRYFYSSLLSPPPLPPLHLLAFHISHSHRSSLTLTAFDPHLSSYLFFPLSFLCDFRSLSPIASSNSLIYLWADSAQISNHNLKNPKSLIVCNPVTKKFKLLPQLGSAWSRHGTVLVSPTGSVIVLTELAALQYCPNSVGDSWMKYSLNMPSKPRSPILVNGSVFTLCAVGSPWRSQWKLFWCEVDELRRGKRGWVQLEKGEWGDVFDVLKRPRLVRGKEKDEILMIGGLRSSFAVDSPCSTVMILRLSLERMEWDEAGRMPMEMYKCFASGEGNNKVKVFGGEGRVLFSGKRVKGRMVIWEEDGDSEGVEGGGRWRWLEGVPGYDEGVYRGFVYDAGLTEIP